MTEADWWLGSFFADVNEVVKPVRGGRIGFDVAVGFIAVRGGVDVFALDIKTNYAAGACLPEGLDVLMALVVVRGRLPIKHNQDVTSLGESVLINAVMVGPKPVDTESKSLGFVDDLLDDPVFETASRAENEDT